MLLLPRDTILLAQLEVALPTTA